MKSPPKKMSIGALAAIFLSLFGLAAGFLLWSEEAAEPHAGVLVTGVQHVGNDFEVVRFFLDGYELGDAGRDGGGGGNICCISIPRKWKPGLTVDLRWEVAQWSKTDPDHMGANGNERALRRNFRARVPLEKYTTPDHLWVHFFPKGKARLISSGGSAEDLFLPTSSSGTREVNSATQGQAIVELFTNSELEQIRRRLDDASEKSGRGWR